MKTRWKLHPSTWNILGIQRPRLIIGVGSWRNASERSAVAVNCIYHLPLFVWGFLPTVCRCGRIAAFVRLVIGSNRRLICPKLSCDRSPRLRGLRRNERCVGRLKGILSNPRLRHSRGEQQYQKHPKELHVQQAWDQSLHLEQVSLELQVMSQAGLVLCLVGLWSPS